MKLQSAIDSLVCLIGNALREATGVGRKLWLVLAIATMLILTAAAGDTGLRASLLSEYNAGRYKTLGHRMKCTCGCGQVLLECTHGVFCDIGLRMRNELTAALQKGDKDDAILRSFTQKYGSAVLTGSLKDMTSLALIGWIAGFAIVAATGSTVIIFLRKRRRPASAAPTLLSDLEGVEADMLRRRVRSATEYDDW